MLGTDLEALCMPNGDKFMRSRSAEINSKGGGDDACTREEILEDRNRKCKVFGVGFNNQGLDLTTFVHHNHSKGLEIRSEMLRLQSSNMIRRFKVGLLDLN